MFFVQRPAAAGPRDHRGLLEVRDDLSRFHVISDVRIGDPGMRCVGLDRNFANVGHVSNVPLSMSWQATARWKCDEGGGRYP